MILGERIAYIRSDLQLSRKSMADKLGIKPTKIQDIETGRQKANGDFLKVIVDNFLISSDWLLTGEGSMYRDDASAAVNDDLVSIDHYPIEASAGFGCYPDDHVLADNKRWFSHKWLSNKGLYSKDLSLIRVHGDSMVPMLQDKDLIMLDTSKTIPTAAMPFVVRVGDVLYVKLLALLSQKTLRLMSANKFYSDIEIDLNDPASGFAVIGAVVWHAHSYV